MGEQPFETYQRITGFEWPGGTSREIVSLLNIFRITHQPGSAAANLELQDLLLAVHRLCPWPRVRP